MNNLHLQLKRQYLNTKLFLAGLLLLSSIPVLAKNSFVDKDVKSFPAIVDQGSDAFQLVSHGRPGALFLDGKWRDAHEIVVFFQTKKLIQKHTKTLNIYGCQFAKGTAGKQAVTLIEKELHIAVAASDNITGHNGDWILEVGKPNHALSFNHYPYSLQLCNDTTYTTINTGWSGAPASPTYSPPLGCVNNNGATSNGTGAFAGWGFNTGYDNQVGYLWTRTLSGLSPLQQYRVRVNMQSYTNTTDLRNGYFNNYNLAGQTGSFTAVGGTPIASTLNDTFTVTGQTSLSFSGTIVGAPFNGCDQVVDFYVSIEVDLITVAPTTSSPTVNSFLVSNACPALLSDLSSNATGCGPGSVLEWHTTAVLPSALNLVANVTALSNGTYYAVCHNAASNCYNNSSAGVTVVNTPCLPLPINFKSVDAKWFHNDVNLNWTIANDENMRYFVVERSFDGKLFTEISKISSLANHKEDYTYSYTDPDVRYKTQEAVFYRIKQIDASSIQSTSKVVNLTNTSSIASAANAFIAPNPIEGSSFHFIYQNIENKNIDLDIQMMDLYGRVLLQTQKTVSKGKNQIQLSLNDLAAGTYYLNYFNKENNVNGIIKVVKK